MLSFVFPLLADSNANIKVQVFVLRKDTADIIGVESNELIRNNQSVKNTSNDVHHFWRLHSPSPASWAKEKAGSLGLPCFDASSIEKLSGDNTHEEKERVLAALATG